MRGLAYLSNDNLVLGMGQKHQTSRQNQEVTTVEGRRWGGTRSKSRDSNLLSPETHNTEAGVLSPRTRTSHTGQSRKPIGPSRELKGEGRVVWGSIREWWGLWPAGSHVSCLSEGSCCFSAPPDSFPEENKLSVASSSDTFFLRKKKKGILKINLPFKKNVGNEFVFFWETP